MKKNISRRVHRGAEETEEKMKHRILCDLRHPAISARKKGFTQGMLRRRGSRGEIETGNPLRSLHHCDLCEKHNVENKK
jgi:hypothetical protein